MREFSTSVSNALANGLKPDESFRDTMFFSDLYNLIPSDMRLRSYQEIIDILPIAQEDRKLYYPFPQWFRLEGDNLVVTEDSLYEVIEYPNPPFDLKSILLDSSELSETMRVADYKDSWLLLNRDGCMYKRGGEVKFSNSLKASSLLTHQNRTLIGGALDGLYTEEFLSELENVADLANLRDSDFSLDIGENFVFWSDYDSAFFPFSLLEPDIVFNDFLQDTAFTELLYSNQFGYIEMPFKGTVLDMVVSNDQVFVFGEDGICSLAVNTQATGATYHITGQQSFGIKKRGAVGGDSRSIVFIDKVNQLWKISGEGLLKMDFSGYMEKLTGDIHITKDPDEEIFYIGDEKTSFLLNDNKLTRIYQTVQHSSGAFPFRGGVTMETGDKKAELLTSRLDIGNTDNKTLTGVAIGLDSPVSGKVRAHVEVNNKKISSPWLPLNPDGYAAVRIYGSQHQLEIKLDNYENINVDHIELKWQIDDKRHRRGTFTTQDSTGAG